MQNPDLLADLLDRIVDHLHDRKGALRNCCLVSKSWVPRTRRHLFAIIRFNVEVHPVSWREIFPDPSTSPAHYTKTLLIDYSDVIAVADIEAGGWIRAFSHVVHLEVCSRRRGVDEPEFPLVPLLGFSPFIKSLHVKFVALPSSQISDLILSFPLLEDVTVVNGDRVPIDDDDRPDGLPTVVQSSNSPTFTGSLNLITTGMKRIARPLLSVPGGLRFRRFTLDWVHRNDSLWTLALAERCSHTLESLDISCGAFRAFIRHPRRHQ